MKKPQKAISQENEKEYLQYIREYYQRNFRNGQSDECFLLWIENTLGKNEED